jgi:hypothetical protein
MSNFSRVSFSYENLFRYFCVNYFYRLLCDCAIDPNTRPQVRDTVLKYQAGTNALIDSGIYDTRDDFTVVRQPFMEHMTVPTTVSRVLFYEKNFLNKVYSLL